MCHWFSWSNNAFSFDKYYNANNVNVKLLNYNVNCFSTIFEQFLEIKCYCFHVNIWEIIGEFVIMLLVKVTRNALSTILLISSMWELRVLVRHLFLAVKSIFCLGFCAKHLLFLGTHSGNTRRFVSSSNNEIMTRLYRLGIEMPQAMIPRGSGIQE